MLAQSFLEQIPQGVRPKHETYHQLLSDSRLRTASINPKEVKLCSGIRQLDEFLHGGLAFSTLTEWGIPFGNGGRHLMASFLANATSGRWEGEQKLWCLWVSARQQYILYPPAWKAIGVDLRHLRFVQSQAPLRELKPLFIDGFFKVLVLDGVTTLSDEDYCFLAHQARLSRQLICVLQDQFLSTHHANVWARLRLNIRSPYASHLYQVECIRGACVSPSLFLSSTWVS